MIDENNNISNTDLDEGGVPEEDGAQHESLRIKRLLPERRIDKYLKQRYGDFSRAMIQNLIREEAVTVNGRGVKCSYQLSAGDQVDMILPPPETREIPGEDIPLDILYEDEYMLALNKPANLVVHPARGNRGGTLVNGLVNYSNSLSHVNGEFRPGIVHRLDRNTTGVMVIAKTDTAHWRLAHQFEYRQTKKKYIAVVHGTMEFYSDVVKMPLGRHPKVREKYAARPETGKQSITTYKVQKQYRGYAVLEVMPKTGRTHQIRVHMNVIKHPVVADSMYGGKTMTLSQMANGNPLPEAGEPGGELGPEDMVIERQALHALELYIRHPISEKEMLFEAPLGKDMELLIELLDRYRGI